MDSENERLRSANQQTAGSLLELHRHAEHEMLAAKKALGQRSEELALALAVMQATLESATDGILTEDAEGNITHFNARSWEMWRMPGPEMMGDAGKARDFAARQLKNPALFYSRFEEIKTSAEESFDILELTDGRFFERHSRVLFVEGRPAGRVWSFRDVTERHVADVNSRRLAAIVDSSDDAIIGKDLNSIITSWNAGAGRIFGYSSSEMIGASIMRLIPPERQMEEQEILSRIKSGERVEHFETVRIAKDGHPLHVSITVSPIRDPAGKVTGASKIARDITGRKLTDEALKKAKEAADTAAKERQQLLESERAARSEAERASRMKDEFLATLSHELRTPLNAVLGWASLLRSGELEGDELEQGLETIERNARAQAQIIEDLLDMSRIISGKIRLNVRAIELSSVLFESLDTVRAAAGAKGIHLEITKTGPMGLISGDPSRLQQVFWNLLNNAIKFTPKGGRVQAHLERTDAEIEVRITDTGEGIAPEFLPYVFDRFKQGDASTTRRHGGLGLGLAIVKQLIELHGGGVSVSSEGSGRGASFTVRLPVADHYGTPEEEVRSPQKTARRQERPALESSLQGIKVLVVDDEPDGRNLVKNLLEMAGATVSTAGSAPDAMSSILAWKPDVLVSDIGMPDEDGYSFIRRVRALEEKDGRDLPAVALTAYARSEDRTKIIRAGFQNHLAKPVEAAELLAVVCSLAAPRQGGSL